jgi:16S rRNA (cytidine1402-2'-O)-methyltransferase
MRPPGRLYVVGLPIGHPEDITLRALRVFREADIVAAKDARQMQTLLRRYRIQAIITTYDRRNAPDKIPVLLHRLLTGSSVALVSDRGTPCIYDPGAQLLAQAHRAGIHVEAIPGPSALTAALSVAGMSGDVVFFRGRLPKSEERCLQLLQALKGRRCTHVFFVDPRRVRHSLTCIRTVFGSTETMVAVDLTKPTQQILRGKVGTLLEGYSLLYRNADVTVVVAGR